MEQKQLDYKRGEGATSVPQLLSLIKEDLLPKLIKEEDSKKRKHIGKTMSEYLMQANNVIRPRTLAKDKTRRDILKIAAPSIKWDKLEKFYGNIISERGSEQYIEYEQEMDDKVISSVKQRVQSLETEIRMLNEALGRRDSIENEVKDERRNSSSSKSTEGSTTSKAERISLLESLVKKQDNEVLVLQKQLSEENSNFVHILKSEYEDIINQIKPCVRKFSGLTGLSNAKKDTEKLKLKAECYTLGRNLRDNVYVLVEQMDKMRDRVHQTTDKFKALEKEKEVCLQLFDYRNEDEEEALSKIIVQEINSWKETKKDMKTEIKSLRKNMELLAERNKELMEELDKANASNEPPKTEPTNKFTPRVRRSSAPIKPMTRKISTNGVTKADDVKKENKAPPIVGVQPKVISFGDYGSPAPVRSRKKSSTTGPFKVTY